MATFGRLETLLPTPRMYTAASKPEMFARERNEIRGSIVLFLLTSSHCVSFGDNELASRIVRGVVGQSTGAGA
jgi:hypothetical protein